jgi:hypothetical protein
LRRLASTEIAQLIDSLFGAATNSGRVAHWMYEQTHGNPLECIELARYLIARGWIQYTEGSWMLPAALPRESPQGLEQTRIICDQQEFAPLHLLLNVDGERKLVGAVAVPLSSSTIELRVPDNRLLSAITASLYLSAPSASQTYDDGDGQP